MDYSCDKTMDDFDDDGFPKDKATTFVDSGYLKNTKIKTFAILSYIYAFVGPIMFLIGLGILKGILGLCCCPVVGMYGLGLLVKLPRPLNKYQERELKNYPVQYDELGWPVHPSTGKRTVRAMSKKSEFFLNMIFFFAFPIAVFCKICGACCTNTKQAEQEQIDANDIFLSEFGSEKRKKKKKKTKKSKNRLLETNIYTDSDATEANDTKYVIEQLRKSEQSLKNSQHFNDV